MDGLGIANTVSQFGNNPKGESLFDNNYRKINNPYYSRKWDCL